MQDLMERTETCLKKRNAEREKVQVVDGYICIEVHESYEYEIPLDECKTVSGALKWLRQVAEKRWMNDDMLWAVADAMSDATGAR